MEIQFNKLEASSEEMLIRYEPDVNVSGPTTIRFDFVPLGPIVSDSILSAARYMASNSGSFSTPSQGSTMTINGNFVGNYDYIVRDTQTISNFSAASWFTSTQDTASAWVIVKGNLTLNSGQTFIPSVRKLFTVVYVTGNLTLNGQISMNQRGANHSGTGTSGGYTAPVNIRVGTGTFSGSIVNPTIPATDGIGGAREVSDGTNATNNLANAGGAATNGGTGGGGTGLIFTNPAGSYAGKGGDGTCFSGGSGSGSIFKNNYSGSPINSDDAGENGGAGTNGAGNTPVGGVGNPSGASAGFGNGTGGTVIVICEGTLTGTGSVQANGLGTQSIGGVRGGGSGGGCVYILTKTNSSTVSRGASGGGTAPVNGGNGTTYLLLLP